jgi:hypothetical protein
MKYKDEYESEIMQPIVWAEMPTKNGVVYPSYLEWLESKYAASRDSRILSATLSEEINILKRVVGLTKVYLEMHMNNEHPQKSMLRLDRDLINEAEDFLNKRGIAG